MKEYIIDNLYKGFVEPYQIPYTSPILFSRKKNRKLRFYIDYRKLNLVTWKD